MHDALSQAPKMGLVCGCDGAMGRVISPFFLSFHSSTTCSGSPPIPPRKRISFAALLSRDTRSRLPPLLTTANAPLSSTLPRETPGRAANSRLAFGPGPSLTCPTRLVLFLVDPDNLKPPPTGSPQGENEGEPAPSGGSLPGATRASTNTPRRMMPSEARLCYPH